MSVVRREGEWRLEKEDDGIYTITHRERPKVKVITSDYSQSGFVDERMDMTLPVSEVDSYSDAESLFDQMANGGAPGGGMAAPAAPTGTNGGGFNLGDGDGDLSDVPPAGLLVGGLIVGGFLIVESGGAVTSKLFLVGGVFLLLPLGVGALTYRAYAEDGADGAMKFLLTADEDVENASDAGGNGSDVKKTPPAPESLKNDLYFGRADRQCEWCDTDVDSPDAHHIKPRKEGGPNEEENLIILCPNCHRKADRGMISRSKLRRAIRD